MNFLKRILIFLKEVKLEMKKVNWPNRQETLRYTLIVVGVSLTVAIYLGGLDQIFQKIIQYLIKL